MALSTDIKLPRSHEPVFPPICVVCECPEPESSLKLVSGTMGGLSCLIGLWHRPLTVRAPACRRCAWKLHAGRTTSVALTILIAILAVVVLWSPIAQALPPGTRRLARLGIILVCLAPVIAYEVFCPRAFEVTPYSESVDYEFSSQSQALAFAAANCHAPWVEIDGHRIDFGTDLDDEEDLHDDDPYL